VGLEAIVLGLQNWIGRAADAAREMAETETDPAKRQNLLEMAEMNAWLVNEPPRPVCTTAAVRWGASMCF